MAAFKPPAVSVGDAVLWRHSPSADPMAALVVGANEKCVEVIVFQPGYHNGFPKSGVHHADDPDLRVGTRMEQGCWEHTPQSKAFLKLLADLSPKEQAKKA